MAEGLVCGYFQVHFIPHHVFYSNSMELPEAVVPAVHINRGDRVVGRTGSAGLKCFV
jgi:hypothetical protein